MAGVAVKVTDDPRQNGFEDAATDTPAGRLLLTTMLIKFEVAGLPVMQVAEAFRMQDTRSPDAGLYVNDELLLPVFIPFTFH